MNRIQANFHLFAEDIDRAIQFYQRHFGFSLLGKLDETDENSWAAMKIENAIIWLGTEGSSNGLILLVDKDMEQFVENLAANHVEFFVPNHIKQGMSGESNILTTAWGKHAWIFDSERNVVMLFMPTGG
ncbi:MAG: VOC family protein [Candidatus Zhuqueibacterota bacterium]